MGLGFGEAVSSQAYGSECGFCFCIKLGVQGVQCLELTGSSWLPVFCSRAFEGPLGSPEGEALGV